MSTQLTKADGSSKSEMQGMMLTLSNPKETVKNRTEALGKIVDLYSNDITAILPKHVDFDRMKQLFILSCKNTPKLLECDPASLMKALFTAAAMGLEPDPYHGQIYLLPFGKNVQVIPGYKGLLQLVRNSGEINSISAQVVCKNDEFDYDLANGERPKHKPTILGPRGEAVAYYCIANFRDGGFHFELMTKDEVNKMREKSSAVKSGKATPWDTDYDEMAKKTVIRRAVKRMPISLTKQTRTALMAEDAYTAGKQVTIDQKTGEAIDIWAEPSVEVEAPQIESKTVSRLDSFAGEAVQAELVDEVYEAMEGGK